MRLRRYGTHGKRPARSHQARLRPSTDVDARRWTYTRVYVRRRASRADVDGRRRARCEWAFTSRPHRSTTYVDAACCYTPSSVVCLSVGLLVCLSRSSAVQKRLNRSRYRLGCGLGRGSRKHVLDWGAHWSNLVSTIKPPLCSSNAALCQIALTICYLILLRLIVLDSRPTIRLY